MQDDLTQTDLSALLAEWVPIAGLELRFGLSRSTSYRLVAEELVDARKVGGKTIVSVASVRRFIGNQPQPAIKTDDRSAKLARRAA